jgi:Holliday junction resolvase
MPNKKYIKGRRKEYKIVNEAKQNGFISFRSAGSHSPIDVVVIDLANKEIKFIQCKPDDMSSNKKFLLEQEMRELNNTFNVSFKVV